MADTGKSSPPSYLEGTPHDLAGLVSLAAPVALEVRQRQRLSQSGCSRRNRFERALAEHCVQTGVGQHLDQHLHQKHRLLRQRFESKVYMLPRVTYHPHVGARGPFLPRCLDQAP